MKCEKKKNVTLELTALCWGLNAAHAIVPTFFFLTTQAQNKYNCHYYTFTMSQFQNRTLTIYIHKKEPTKPLN